MSAKSPVLEAIEGRRLRAPVRRRFTVDEYHRMGRAGVFPRGEHVELIEGEIFRMCPIGDRHVVCVDRTNTWFTPRLIGRAIVRVQNPVRPSGRSEPEPDLTLLRWNDDFYSLGQPGPHDILLIIEVSDSSLRYDRNRKLPMYAEAGIQEVWIVNLRANVIEVYRGPSERQYTEVTRFQRGASISPLAFPDLDVPVEAILGPA